MRLVPGRAACLGALFAALVTLPALAGGTLWDNSETSYGEVAREILLTGDWTVMHLDGVAWFVQPPLYFWLGAIFGRLFGMSEFAVRLPSALATIAMSGALGYAVAREAGIRAGTVASLVLATSLMQAIVGRLAIMDALLDLCVAAAILWWYRACEPSNGGAPSEGRRSTAFLSGAAALALGTLAKGPVAPVIVLLVVGAWILWERRSGSAPVLPRAATLLAAALLYAALVVPWFAALTLRVGPHAAAELLGHYTIGRYTGIIENQTGPWWYYLPVVVLGFFPWIAFLPAAATVAVRDARSAGGSLARLAIVWTVLPLVFFSFAQTKLPNYVALMLPAPAVLVGCWFERAAEGRKRRVAVLSAAALPVFVGLVGIAILAFSRTNRFDLGPLFGPLRLLGAGMLAGTLLTLCATAVRRTAAAAPYVLGATSGALVLFIAFVAEPAVEPLKPVPHFARIIQAERGPQAVVGIRGAAGGNGLIFYTRPVVLGVADDDAAFVAAICPAADFWLVTWARDAERLGGLARSLGRRVTRFEDVDRVTLLHVDGPRCSGPGARPR